MEARDPALARPGRSWRAQDLLALAPALILLATLFSGSLLGAAKVSLVPLGAGIGDASLDQWRALFDDPAFVDSLLFTVRIAVLSTVLAAVVGFVLALALRRAGGAIARTLVALPIPLPHLLVAVVAVVWLAPGGLAGRLLGGLPFDFVRDRQGWGVIAVYAYKEAPFIALLVLAAMGRSLTQREEAAAVLGAGALQRVRWVLWPTIRGPLMIACVIVSAFAVGGLEVPLAIGPNYPPALAEFAYQATQGNVITGEAQAAAALLIAGAMAIALATVAVRFARSLDDE